MKQVRRSGIRLILYLLGLMVVVHIVNILSGGTLVQLGILPRDPSSLVFIFTAPFIHANWMHLLNNLLGLAVFSGFCLLKGVQFYLRSSLFIIAASGLLLWLFGRAGLHVGASGWIFGLWSLTIALAVFERSLLNIVVALVVVIFYGGMAFGMMPSNPLVSFEGHIFGALAGVVAAAYYGRRRRPRR